MAGGSNYQLYTSDSAIWSQPMRDPRREGLLRMVSTLNLISLYGLIFWGQVSSKSLSSVRNT
jgi:hypothetical protein